MAQKPSTIFINPKFKNAHINPNFLQTNKIHINPKFLIQNIIAVPPETIPVQPIVQRESPAVVNSNAIIRNTRRTLIRVPISRSSTEVTQQKTFVDKKLPQQQQLIKVSKNKLVTAAHLMRCQQKENEKIKSTTESIIKTKKLQRKTESKPSIYRLDRRSSPIKKKKIVSTYSIRRVETISPKKVIVSDKKMLRMGESSTSADKSLVMININGVLYKSTSRKLEKTSTSSLSKLSLNPSEKMLIIRGEKFILDTSGRRLKRESENESSSLKLSRIDIGGLTYKASRSGAFERDNSHQIRSHLSLAKTKSILLLSHNKMKKTNEICPIYRRLGKCLAYANGRCQKVHDQRYVLVCPRYLKGSCKIEKCLLSHNANLHKMPVCKYFLQGLCQKQRDCLYLHKKLTDDTKLCLEFVRGYCPRAEKCNLLHDFPQTDQREKRKFSIVRNKARGSSKKSVEKLIESAQQADTNRYYFDESAQSSDGNVPKRGKLGALPSYIPL